MTRVSRLCSAWLLLFSATTLLAAEPPAAEKPGDKPAVDTQAALEKKFAETMSGATLVGYSANVNSKNAAKPAEDRYTIENAIKLKGDTWLFTAKIGEHGPAIPIPLEVKWAGDTPVITVSDFKVPGIGTYTARVLVFDGQYAGTWSGYEHGGQIYGKIVKKGEGDAKSPEKSPEKTPDKKP